MQPRFRDYAAYMRRLYVTPRRWHTSTGAVVRCMKIRWFNFGVGEDANNEVVAHSNEVWFRYSLD